MTTKLFSFTKILVFFYLYCCFSFLVAVATENPKHSDDSDSNSAIDTIYIKFNDYYKNYRSERLGLNPSKKEQEHWKEILPLEISESLRLELTHTISSFDKKTMILTLNDPKELKMVFSGVVSRHLYKVDTNRFIEHSAKNFSLKTPPSQLKEIYVNSENQKRTFSPSFLKSTRFGWILFFIKEYPLVSICLLWVILMLLIALVKWLKKK
ncbi:MAG: hypothetical protein HQK53_02525 [Oligoflexia bacterium]|nr:hypothetical protein [Oligoflexia bacterium]